MPVSRDGVDDVFEERRPRQQQKQKYLKKKREWTRRNSREEVSWSDLPDDVMCRVLARLPVRKLVQVRTVCKQWNSIITSSCFEELWTEQTSSSSSSSQEAAAYFPLLLCPGGGEGETHYHEFCLAYDHTANQWQRMPSLSFLPPGVRIPMTGAGGLLCFRRDTSLFLCNPLTKAIQELPVIARKWIHYASVHLIVDKRARAFKVIVAGKLRHNSSSSSLRDAFGSIAIFESSSCSCSSSSSSSASAAGGGWRSIDSLPPKVFSYGRTAAMCKGFIYCEAICYNGKVGVAAYDVERERWNDVIHQVPHDDNGDYELSDVVECGGWIWMVVGRGYGGIITRIYILKLLLLGVTATPPPPPPPHPLSQQAAAGVLTLLPADANSFSNTQEEEEEEIARQDCCWRRVTDLPNELLDKLRDVWFGEDESSSLAIVAHGSRICIAAGKSLMLVYNIIHDSWSVLPPFSPWHWKAIDTYGGAEPTSFPVELSFSCPLQTN